MLPCSLEPMTGFYRDGCCGTGAEDVGSHTVCAVMTEEFLEFSRLAGNDLSTPRPEWGFEGLPAPGDRWCLCAPRWLEAHEAARRPRSCSARRMSRALEFVPIELSRRLGQSRRTWFSELGVSALEHVGEIVRADTQPARA